MQAHFCNSVYNVEPETPIKDEREKPKVTTETIENTKSVTETLRKDESEKSESIGDLKQDKKRAKQPRVRNKSKKNLSKPPEKDNLRESSEDKKQKESKEVKEKEETGGSEMEIQPTETRKRKRKRRSHKKEAKKMNLGNSPTEQVGCTKPKQEFKVIITRRNTFLLSQFALSVTLGSLDCLLIHTNEQVCVLIPNYE